MISFVIIVSLVLLGTTVISNYYITNFIKKEKIKYNTQLISTLSYEVDSFYQQMINMVNNYNSNSLDTDIKKIVNTKFNFQSMREEVKFDNEVTKKIYINGLNNIVKDVVFYVNDNNYYFVGGGSLDKDIDFNNLPWFHQYKNSEGPHMIYGPVFEEYKSGYSKKEKVLLFFGRMHTTSNYSSHDVKPFILVSVNFSKVEEFFDNLFQASRGIIVSDFNNNIIYNNNVSSNHMDLIKDNNIYSTVTSQENNISSGTFDDVFMTNILVEDYNWVISTLDSTEEMFRDVNNLSLTLVVIVTIFGFIGIVLYHLSVKQLMLPIHKLYNLIDTIEETNDAYIEIDSKDEIGTISRRFNEMKKKLLVLNSQIYLLEVREKEAQISALQAQINPHFLYNVLDNIYCIAQIEEIETIATLSYRLSNMMSYSIDNKDRYSSLIDEINHGQAYIDIINVRYTDYVEFIIRVEEEVEDARSIKFFLQPIIENAWIHGILNKPSRKGKIIIDAFREKEELVVIVEDDGIGIKADLLQTINDSLKTYLKEIRNPQSKGKGIALANVNDRIKLSSGNEYGILVESKINVGTRVIVRQKLVN